jgi:hypothetical protein
VWGGRGVEGRVDCGGGGGGWPCILYENDERCELDTTTVIYYHKLSLHVSCIYMPIFRSTGCMLLHVLFSTRCSGCNPEELTRSFYTVCKFISDCHVHVRRREGSMASRSIGFGSCWTVWQQWFCTIFFWCSCIRERLLPVWQSKFKVCVTVHLVRKWRGVPTWCNNWHLLS